MNLSEKRLKIAIPAIVMAILVLAALFFPFQGDESEESEMHTSYVIKTMAPDDESYTLILPIPVDENGDPLPLTEQLHIEGNGSFEILNESYGWVVRVDGRGDLVVSGEMNYFSEPTFPSIVNSTGPPVQNPKYSWEEKIPGYWNTTIYSSKRDILLSISYSSNKICGYEAEGISWGTFKWNEEEGKWDDSIYLNENGWVPLTLNVTELLRNVY